MQPNEISWNQVLIGVLTEAGNDVLVRWTVLIPNEDIYVSIEK